MVLRLLIRLLSNNEHLIQRLSESYPVRKAAQWVVVFFYKGKDLINDHNLKRVISSQEFKDIIQKFAANIKKQIKK